MGRFKGTSSGNLEIFGNMTMVSRKESPRKPIIHVLSQISRTFDTTTVYKANSSQELWKRAHISFENLLQISTNDDVPELC